MFKEIIPEELWKFIRELESDASLRELGRLRERIEALDLMEAYLLPSGNLPFVVGGGPAFYGRALAIQDQFEALNSEVYDAIREDIQQGCGRESLLRWLPCLREITASPTLHREGYDYLDEVLAGVLQFEEPAGSHLTLPEESVFYQPTPARHIFDLLERLDLTERDVLVDVGSGLGQVSLVTSIWTSAPSVGIELDPAYVECARRVAEALHLRNVSFVAQDARDADFRDGTVFFFYTPFTGAMLRTVLDRLRREAGERPIRVGTFGPCAPVFAAEEWLEAAGPVRPDRIALFRSRA